MTLDGWRIHEVSQGVRMHQSLFIASRATLDNACDLIARFGDDAGVEAAARAERSRDIGNVLHFCEWRQIERAILLLTHDEAVGTIH